jgi:homoserine dehydrogenase
MKNKVTLGLIGYGTVGKGVVKILKKHAVEMERRCGARLELKIICDNSRRGVKLPAGTRLTKDWRDVVNDPGLDIVVELIGGYEPAHTIVRAALIKGKHVVTANKAILSRHWGELFELANRYRRLLYFEASVGGGIPIIQALNEGLAANRIERISGVLNGTTNYILTRMEERGEDFATALGDAQKAGFAEANPSFDVEGVDAAHKIAILASIATGGWVRLKDVYREGIARIEPVDLAVGRERLDSTIKLLGIASWNKKGLEIKVHPAFVSRHHPFANVRNEYNAVCVEGDAVGDVILYGKGAGGLAAASAVVSDIIFLARQVASGTAGQIPYVSCERSRSPRVVPMEESWYRYYLRLTTADRPGVLARITGALGRCGVSIASVYQDVKEGFLKPGGVPIVLITHRAREESVQRARRLIDGFPAVREKTALIRILD